VSWSDPEALVDVPLTQGRDALLQGVVRQYASIGGQVPHNAIGGGRQKAAPFDLEMVHCSAVAFAGVSRVAARK
jgi:hypothetical protein